MAGKYWLVFFRKKKIKTQTQRIIIRMFWTRHNVHTLGQIQKTAFGFLEPIPVNHVLRIFQIRNHMRQLTGFTKIFLVIYRDHPVTYLMMGIVITRFITGMLILFGNRNPLLSIQLFKCRHFFFRCDIADRGKAVITYEFGEKDLLFANWTFKILHRYSLQNE